jgi:hypothetical protein
MNFLISDTLKQRDGKTLHIRQRMTIYQTERNVVPEPTLK